MVVNAAHVELLDAIAPPNERRGRVDTTGRLRARVGGVLRDFEYTGLVAHIHSTNGRPLDDGSFEEGHRIPAVLYGDFEFQRARLRLECADLDFARPG